MTAGPRIAAPPGWRTTTPDDGPLLSVAQGPVHAATGMAPSIVAVADATDGLRAALDATLVTLTDPHVVEVDPAAGTALLSHDVAGIGVTSLVRRTADGTVLVTGSAPDAAWPAWSTAITACIRTAGS